MRYRPFGRSGSQVSAVSLCVPDSGIRDGERVKLIVGAMELGVSGFEVRAGAEAAETGLGTALTGIDHNLVVVGARIGHVKGEKGSPFQPEAIRAAIQGVLAFSGSTTSSWKIPASANCRPAPWGCWTRPSAPGASA